jgi:hypothetical protein
MRFVRFDVGLQQESALHMISCVTVLFVANEAGQNDV